MEPDDRFESATAEMLPMFEIDEVRRQFCLEQAVQCTNLSDRSQPLLHDAIAKMALRFEQYLRDGE